MKKLFFLALSFLWCFHSSLFAQCDGVTAEAFPLSPQSGAYNYFGVRVSLAQPYNQDVVVTGYIYNEGSPIMDNPYTLTVIAGNLTAETEATYYQTDPTSVAVATIESVTPCPTILPDSLIQIFRGVNTTILQNSDSNIVANYLKGVNQQIKDYLTQKYPQYLPNDSINVNDPMTILFGLTYAVTEANGFQQPIDTTETSFLKWQNDNIFQNSVVSTIFHENKYGQPIFSGPFYNVSEVAPLSNPSLKNTFKVPTWVRCVVDVTLGYFDIVSLINGLGTFEFGTVWTVVKFAIKKYVGWIGAAILIYDLTTECL